MWRIHMYPVIMVHTPAICSLVIIIEHLTKSTCSKAIVEAFLMDKRGNPSVTFWNRSQSRVFETGRETVGWLWDVPQTDLVENYKIDGQITIICSIMVQRDSYIPVPPSDIGKHLGQLLDSTDGTDVSFNVGGEMFHAHRAVFAARSPVFKAELLGSMAEATMPSITLHDITPATFKAMLRFMYTDSLTRDDKFEMKLVCAQKLWNDVSVDTAAVTLGCAEMYSCPELKNKCMDFFAKEENFKKAVLTKGFLELGLQFPSIIDELRERVGL